MQLPGGIREHTRRAKGGTTGTQIQVSLMQWLLRSRIDSFHKLDHSQLRWGIIPTAGSAGCLRQGVVTDVTEWHACQGIATAVAVPTVRPRCQSETVAPLSGGSGTAATSTRLGAEHRRLGREFHSPPPANCWPGAHSKKKPTTNERLQGGVKRKQQINKMVKHKGISLATSFVIDSIQLQGKSQCQLVRGWVCFACRSTSDIPLFGAVGQPVIA